MWGLLKAAKNLAFDLPRAIKKTLKEGRDLKPAYRKAYHAWDDALEDGRLEEHELDRALEKTKAFVMENFHFAELIWRILKPIARRVL